MPGFRIDRGMEVYRVPLDGVMGNHLCGRFYIPSQGLMIIAASGEGWDHVSVSCKDRTPTWEEMEWVRRRFFDPEVTVIQLHPPLPLYRNINPNVLHMWRPWNHAIPLPPPEFI